MNQHPISLQSNVRLKKTLKKHTTGLEKAIPPTETVQNLQNLLESIELDLVQEVIRIDSGRLRIPVYICQVGKDCNTPTPKTMGKGPTPEQSRASALMEMVERFSHANFPRPDSYMKGAIGEINGDVIPVEHLFKVPGRDATAPDECIEEFSSLPFAWVPAYSLVQRKDILIPYEWFADVQGTNGLSAGNTMEETILQGLCEVVERHVCAAVNVNRDLVPTIDLGTVQNPVARELIEKFLRNNIRIMCKDFSLDTGIPTVAGIAFDPSSYPNSEIVYCAGTATHPEQALIRVLTEIQQMAVDYFKQDYYAGGILPKFRNWQECSFLFDESEPVAIQSLPDVSSGDLLEEIERCTSALQRIGFEPLVVNITHPVLKIPAVFVMMPGSELFEISSHELGPVYYLGRRLEFLGRLDEAIEHFQLSMKQNPKTKLHCMLEIANCLKFQQRWEKAFHAYRDAYCQGPDRAMQMQMLRALQICSDKLKESGGGIGGLKMGRPD